MYSQANVRAGKVLRPPIRALPSVIVVSEKVLREADGSVKLVMVRPHTDEKVFAPGCTSKTGGARRSQAVDMASPKYKKSTIWHGMRGRDAVRKSTLKVNILQVFTIDSSEIQFIVNHSSQSDGQNRSAEGGMNLRKKTIHIISLQRKRKDTKDNGILLTLNKAGNDGPMKLRSDFRAAVSMNNRLHHESGEQVEESLHPNQQRRWHSSSSASWWDKSGWNWK